MKRRRVFFASGDAGDIISSLVSVRHLGGGHYVIGPHVGLGAPREPMTPWRAAFLLPLIERQPYIKSASFDERQRVAVTHDFSTFRALCPLMFGECLTHWHARHLGIDGDKMNLSPWLKVKPSRVARGKIVFSRTLRNRNEEFPWGALVRKYGAKAIFVGTPEEHRQFVREFGRVAYHAVGDALEMAQVIAGSDWFCGNQSLPCWIAMGLGHTLSQETIPSAPNSIVRRPNARFFNFDLASV